MNNHTSKSAKRLNLHCAKNRGFSLIEILVSLIIISLIVSAFVPIVTKKLKSSDITIGSFSTPVSSNCDEFSKEGYKCLMCSDSSCTLCQSQLNIPANYYVDPSDSCKPKKCSDKFGSSCLDCTQDKCNSCANVSAGYYASPEEGCAAKKCSDKFTEGCSACTKDYCTSCKGGYGFNAITHTCTKCNGGYASLGGNSGCTKCEPGSVATEGASVCTLCSVANHKVPNSANTQCVDKYCGKGQLIDGVTCTSCTGGTYQDLTNHQNTTCKTCDVSLHKYANATTGATGCLTKNCGVNEYIDGVTCKPCAGATYQSSTSHQNTSCSSCPSECSSCESATKCTGCTGSYTLSADGKCALGCNPQTVTLSGTTTQVTRFNMGDDPQCPRDVIAAKAGITFVPAGTSCTGNDCCWYGTTSGSCTDESGGIYSGCNRTVCKWYAAEKICASIGTGWQLPNESTDTAKWKSDNSTAKTGLMLCYKDATHANYSRCSVYYGKCPGAKGDYCAPYNVFTSYSSGDNMKFRSWQSGYSWSVLSEGKAHAYSVRCIKK